MSLYEKNRPVLIILLAFFMISGLVACYPTSETPGGDGTVPDADEIH